MDDKITFMKMESILNTGPGRTLFLTLKVSYFLSQ